MRLPGKDASFVVEFAKYPYDTTIVGGRSASNSIRYLEGSPRIYRLQQEMDAYMGHRLLSLRTSLIVGSACVAAKSDLFKGDDRLVALLSLSVAIGTSLDTWLKTGTRYKGHYTFYDNFDALHTDLELSDARDSAVRDKLKEQFKKLIDDYAVAVLPT